MTRTMMALVVMLLGSLPADAQVFHLSCDGTRASVLADGASIAMPNAKSVIVDLKAGVVKFGDMSARITEAGSVFVRFEGDAIAEGTIDRVTGKLLVREVHAGWPQFHWNLTCRTVHPLF
jgi:hypothetical protein